jgi:hypothetical protein
VALPEPDDQGFAPLPVMDRRSSGDLVAVHIRSLIFNGELRQGDRMRQDEIARRLGVSRIPVREAIIALDREGWLTITPHRGAFVHGLDEDALRDHYELLGLVYGLAARRATERATDDGLKRLRDAQQQLAAADAPDTLHDANDAFLRTLLSLRTPLGSARSCATCRRSCPAISSSSSTGAARSSSAAPSGSSPPSAAAIPTPPPMPACASCATRATS